MQLYSGSVWHGILNLAAARSKVTLDNYPRKIITRPRELQVLLVVILGNLIRPRYKGCAAPVGSVNLRNS